MAFHRLALFLAVILISSTTAAQDHEDTYRIGTDVGAKYLSEFSGTLRVTLLLQECQFNELASALATRLPNTVQYAVDKTGQPAAAQITRAYVLGYEIGVRTEFERTASDEKKMQCSLAAAAAGQLMK